MVRRFLLLIALILGMTFPASAQLTAMEENEMADISGRFGFFVPTGETIGLKMAADTIYYHDADGVAPLYQGGFLSFCGIKMNASITMGAPVSVETGTFRSIIDNAMVTGMSFLIDDMTIHIDDFSIDAIRVGNTPGTGLSFGAFGMQNFVMEISGKIQVYTH